MSNKLGGRQGTAYLGTNAEQPPNITFNDRPPLPTDINNVSVGDFWLDQSAIDVVHNVYDQSLWFLVSLAGNGMTKGAVAHWVLVQSGNPIYDIIGGHDITVTPVLGQLRIDLTNAITLGDLAPIAPGAPALTAQTGDITITAGNLNLPVTTSATSGVITVGSVPVLNTFPNGSNLLIGANAGNYTMNPASIGNVSLGYETLRSLTTGDYNICLGTSAGTSITSGGGNICVGYNTCELLDTGDVNVFVGGSSGSVLTSGNENISVGSGNLSLLVSGSGNNAFGSVVLSSLLTGSDNIAIGGSSGSAYVGAESNNILIGSTGTIADNGAIRVGAHGTQTSCTIAGIIDVAIGAANNFGRLVMVDSADKLGTFNIDGNIFAGAQSGNTTTTGLSNIGIGALTLAALTTGNGNVIAGAGSGQVLTSGTANIILGNTSATYLSTGDNNTIVGAGAAKSGATGLLTGSNNILIGLGAGNSYIAAESNNIILGNSGVVTENGTIRIGAPGTHNVCLIAGIYGVPSGTAGQRLVLAGNTGQLGTEPINDNIFGGIGSGNATLSGIANLCIGEDNGSALTTGNANVLLGSGSGNLITTGAGNICAGAACLAALLSGSNNIGVGGGALSLLTTGASNISIGGATLAALLTGSNNIVIGAGSGSAYVGAEANNILINSGGVAAEAGVIRIGDPAENTTCFISGITGVTTGGAAVAVLVDANGQLGTVSSSARYKENIKDMDDYSSKLLDLRPVTFNYKKDPAKRLNPGLIAEEVAEVYPDLVTYNDDGTPETVQYHLLCTMLLNEIQKLRKMIEEK